MHMNPFSEEIEVTEDDFTWSMEMQMRIRRWFLREKLTPEDAFRTLDKNYHNVIN